MIVHKKHIPIVVWALFPLRRPASAFVGCWGLCGPLWISCTSKKKYIKKKKLTSGPNDVSGAVWALFPLHGPAWAFVGCWGLRGPSWISCTSKKNTFKKKTHLWPKRRQTRRLGPFTSSWASFSLFVGLRWLLWAFVGLHGCRPRQRGGV